MEMLKKSAIRALNDVKDEVGHIETSLVAIESDIKSFVRPPIGPLGHAIARNDF